MVAMIVHYQRRGKDVVAVDWLDLKCRRFDGVPWRFPGFYLCKSGADGSILFDMGNDEVGYGQMRLLPRCL
jgi:hypothetical protein